MKRQSESSLSIAEIISIVLLTALFLGITIWMVIPAPAVGFYWDDNWYLLMAEWLTPDSQYRGLSIAMMGVTSYPPLFSFLISLSGSGLLDQQSAFVMNAFFLAFATGVAMLWFAREGFSTVTMTIAAMLMVFNPVTLGYLPILYSEFLFIFLSTSALAMTVVEREWKWNSKWLAIGVIVGLSVATRTAGWSLVVGLILHLIFNRRLLPVVAFIIGLAIGLLTIPFLTVGLPSPEVNYMDQLTRNMDNLGWSFVVQQLQGLIIGWSMLWGWGVGAWLAAIAVLPGFVVRVKANRADAWFVLVYLGMLLIWPWPGHMGRFLWPLLPCFLVAAYSSFKLLRNPRARSVLASVILGLIFVTSIPDGIGRSVKQLLNPPAGELAQLSRMQEWTRSSTREEGMAKLRDRQQLLKDMQKINDIVDIKACIFSEMSGLVAVQTQRVAFPSLWKSLDQVKLTQSSCKYYYMLPETFRGASIEDVNRFAAMHEELFRSFTPDGSEGKMPLGVFLRFRHSTTK